LGSEGGRPATQQIPLSLSGKPAIVNRFQYYDKLLLEIQWLGDTATRHYGWATPPGDRHRFFRSVFASWNDDRDVWSWFRSR